MKIARKYTWLGMFIFSQVVQADPWFTGPFFAEPGQTVPWGHINAYIQTSHMESNAIYNRGWHQEATPTSTSTQISPQFMYGLADKFDIQYTGYYVINQNEQIAYEHIGDTTIMLGYQALSQTNNLPNLRITIEQIIPTGLYNNLPASYNGSNVTGIGSNQTTLGFNFDYLSKLTETHYLNMYLNLWYTHAGDVDVRGINAFGGTHLTRGRITPGDSLLLDIASELALTQQWVAVLEGVYIYQQASKFNGVIGARTNDDPVPIGKRGKTRRFAANPHRLFPNRHNIGNVTIGNGTLDQFTLTPAIEYNFSENYGVIAGVWFTVAGKNTPVFATPMIMFNSYW